MSVAPRSLPALLCAALASVLLVGTVTRVLWTRVEDVRDRPIAPAGTSPTVMPLVAVSQDGTLQRLTLHTAAADAVRAHEEIDIALATGGRGGDGRPRRAVRGRLPLCDGPRHARDARPPRPVRPDARRATAARADRPPSRSRCGCPDASRSCIWVLAPSGAPPADALIVGDAAEAASGSSPRWLAIGRYVAFRAASGMRRVHLLTYLWQLTPTAQATVAGRTGSRGVLAISGVLMFAGAFLCLRAASAVRGYVWTGAGAGCLTLALGVLYAVLVPPFQAPDEPDHFLAFADLAGRPDLKEQAAAWARLGHLQRIRNARRGALSPVRRHAALRRSLGRQVFPIAITGRSRTTAALWTVASAASRAGCVPPPCC